MVHMVSYGSGIFTTRSAPPNQPSVPAFVPLIGKLEQWKHAPYLDTWGPFTSSWRLGIGVPLHCLILRGGQTAPFALIYVPESGRAQPWMKSGPCLAFHWRGNDAAPGHAAQLHARAAWHVHGNARPCCRYFGINVAPDPHCVTIGFYLICNGRR